MWIRITKLEIPSEPDYFLTADSDSSVIDDTDEDPHFIEPTSEDESDFEEPQPSTSTGRPRSRPPRTLPIQGNNVLQGRPRPQV